MKPRLLAGSAVGLIFVAGSALAQMAMLGNAPYSATTPGWYGAVDVGAHTLEGTDWVPQDPAVQQLREKTLTNVDVFLRAGYRFSPYFRLELEGGYRPATIKGVSANTGNPTFICNNNSTISYNDATGAFNGGSCFRPNGYTDQWTGMVNGIVDLLPHSRLTPFLGGGIGVDYARTHLYGYADRPRSSPRHRRRHGRLRRFQAGQPGLSGPRRPLLRDHRSGQCRPDLSLSDRFAGQDRRGEQRRYV